MKRTLLLCLIAGFVLAAVIMLASESEATEPDNAELIIYDQFNQDTIHQWRDEPVTFDVKLKDLENGPMKADAVLVVSKGGNELEKEEFSTGENGKWQTDITFSERGRYFCWVEDESGTVLDDSNFYIGGLEVDKDIYAPGSTVKISLLTAPSEENILINITAPGTDRPLKQFIDPADASGWCNKSYKVSDLNTAEEQLMVTARVGVGNVYTDQTGFTIIIADMLLTRPSLDYLVGPGYGPGVMEVYAASFGPGGSAEFQNGSIVVEEPLAGKEVNIDLYRFKRDEYSIELRYLDTENGVLQALETEYTPVNPEIQELDYGYPALLPSHGGSSLEIKAPELLGTYKVSVIINDQKVGEMNPAYLGWTFNYDLPVWKEADLDTTPDSFREVATNNLGFFKGTITFPAMDKWDDLLEEPLVQHYKLQLKRGGNIQDQTLVHVGTQTFLDLPRSEYYPGETLDITVYATSLDETDYPVDRVNVTWALYRLDNGGVEVFSDQERRVEKGVLRNMLAALPDTDVDLEHYQVRLFRFDNIVDSKDIFVRTYGEIELEPHAMAEELAYLPGDELQFTGKVFGHDSIPMPNSTFTMLLEKFLNDEWQAVESWNDILTGPSGLHSFKYTPDKVGEYRLVMQRFDLDVDIKSFKVTDILPRLELRTDKSQYQMGERMTLWVKASNALTGEQLDGDKVELFIRGQQYGKTVLRENITITSMWTSRTVKLGYSLPVDTYIIEAMTTYEGEEKREQNQIGLDFPSIQISGPESTAASNVVVLDITATPYLDFNLTITRVQDNSDSLIETVPFKGNQLGQYQHVMIMSEDLPAGAEIMARTVAKTPSFTISDIHIIQCHRPLPDIIVSSSTNKDALHPGDTLTVEYFLEYEDGALPAQAYVTMEASTPTPFFTMESDDTATASGSFSLVIPNGIPDTTLTLLLTAVDLQGSTGTDRLSIPIATGLLELFIEDDSLPPGDDARCYYSFDGSLEGVDISYTLTNTQGKVVDTMAITPDNQGFFQIQYPGITNTYTLTIYAYKQGQLLDSDGVTIRTFEGSLYLTSNLFTGGILDLPVGDELDLSYGLADSGLTECRFYYDVQFFLDNASFFNTGRLELQGTELQGNFSITVPEMPCDSFLVTLYAVDKGVVLDSTSIRIRPVLGTILLAPETENYQSSDQIQVRYQVDTDLENMEIMYSLYGITQAQKRLVNESDFFPAPDTGNGEFTIQFPKNPHDSYLLVVEAYSHGFTVSSTTTFSRYADYTVVFEVTTESKYTDNSYKPGDTINIQYNVIPLGEGVLPEKVTIAYGIVGEGTTPSWSETFETGKREGHVSYRIPSQLPDGTYEFGFSGTGNDGNQVGESQTLKVESSPSFLKRKVTGGMSIGEFLILLVALAALFLATLATMRVQGSAEAGKKLKTIPKGLPSMFVKGKAAPKKAKKTKKEDDEEVEDRPKDAFYPSKFEVPEEIQDIEEEPKDENDTSFQSMKKQSFSVASTRIEPSMPEEKDTDERDSFEEIEEESESQDELGGEDDFEKEFLKSQQGDVAESAKKEDNGFKIGVERDDDGEPLLKDQDKTEEEVAVSAPTHKVPSTSASGTSVKAGHKGLPGVGFLHSKKGKPSIEKKKEEPLPKKLEPEKVKVVTSKPSILALDKDSIPKSSWAKKEEDEDEDDL